MDSATIEQMNKLRKSLGLPLLGPQANESSTPSSGPSFRTNGHQNDGEEPASTLDTREAAAYGNLQALQDEQRRQKEREARKKSLQKARDAAARFSKLQGRGLGDASDDDEQDTRAWLKGQKKRQEQIERRRLVQLEEDRIEAEKTAARGYSSKDLAGVQVAHEIGDFEDGIDQQILTLQDKDVLDKDGLSDEEGDVLENADLLARDRLKQKLDAKKKISYDTHNVDDGDGKELLSQYDEKKRKAFRFDAHGSSIEERDAKRQALGDQLKNTINLDILKPAEPVSDYLELKIKKPKKIKKNKRVKDLEEDEFRLTHSSQDQGAMDVDTQQPVPSRSKTALVEEDEALSSALALSRKAALKKKKLTTEDLVKQIKQEEELEAQDSAEINSAIVLDDTTAFLDNLQTRSAEEERPRPQVESLSTPASQAADPDQNGLDDDTHMQDSLNEAYALVEGDEQTLLTNLIKNEETLATSTGLETEQTLSAGLGAAVSLLRSRGLIHDPNVTDIDKNSLYRQRQSFITAQRLRESQSESLARAARERDRASGRHSGLSVREREEQARYENERRSQMTSVQAAAAFNKEYKPDVELKYVDDQGRLLNTKEAFKHLSHQFHGKGSGKGKTEKQLKKREEERRALERGVLDVGGEGKGGYGNLGGVGKRDRTAGIRLG